MQIFLFATLFSFLGNSLCVSLALAVSNELQLPVPGEMIRTSPPYIPTLIKGIRVHPQNPLQIDFIVHQGEDEAAQGELKKESQKLIHYFLTTLTVPEDRMWVNLSPYEKNRIIPDELSQTEMGRDLLAQDYILKQLTASLMYPEEEIGKDFWQRIYTKAREKYGTTDIPMDTFNKVWIVPEKAIIQVNGNTAYVRKHHLKVMLEEDYLALEQNQNHTNHGVGKKSKADADPISSINISKQVIQDVIVPEIEKEVNQGKNFAQLRQIFHSVILATWYKQNLKASFLSQVYVDQKKMEGLELAEKETKERIYAEYLEAFKKGVYDYIREDYDPETKEVIPRKYFSGGVVARVPIVEDFSMAAGPREELNGLNVVRTNLEPQGLQGPIHEESSAISLRIKERLRRVEPAVKGTLAGIASIFAKYRQEIIQDVEAAKERILMFKEDGSAKTIADVEIQNEIIDMVIRELPDFRILAEEAKDDDRIIGVNQKNHKSPWEIVIDSIDGTAEFLSPGSVRFGATIAIKYQGDVVAMLFYAPEFLIEGYESQNKNLPGSLFEASLEYEGIKLNGRSLKVDGPMSEVVKSEGIIPPNIMEQEIDLGGIDLNIERKFSSLSLIFARMATGLVNQPVFVAGKNTFEWDAVGAFLVERAGLEVIYLDTHKAVLPFNNLEDHVISGLFIAGHPDLIDQIKKNNPAVDDAMAVTSIVHVNNKWKEDFILPSDMFLIKGEEVNLIDMFTDAWTAFADEKGLPKGTKILFKIEGSPNYAVDQEGNIDWKNLGDFDFTIFLPDFLISDEEFVSEFRMRFPGYFLSKALGERGFNLGRAVNHTQVIRHVPISGRDETRVDEWSVNMPIKPGKFSDLVNPNRNKWDNYWNLFYDPYANYFELVSHGEAKVADLSEFLQKVSLEDTVTNILYRVQTAVAEAFIKYLNTGDSKAFKRMALAAQLLGEEGLKEQFYYLYDHYKSQSRYEYVKFEGDVEIPVKIRDAENPVEMEANEYAKSQLAQAKVEMGIKDGDRYTQEQVNDLMRIKYRAYREKIAEDSLSDFVRYVDMLELEESALREKIRANLVERFDFAMATNHSIDLIDLAREQNVAIDADTIFIPYIKENFSGSQTAPMLNYAFSELGINVRLIQTELNREQAFQAYEEFKKDPRVGGIHLSSYETEFFSRIKPANEDALALNTAEMLIKDGQDFVGVNLEGENYVRWMKRDLGNDVLKNSKIVILGAGVAGQAIARSLSAEETASSITITDINVEMESHVDKVKVADGTAIEFIGDQDQLQERLQEADIVINATGKIGQSPIANDMRMKKGARALDLNYKRKSAFLDIAESQGLDVIDGRGYLYVVNAYQFGAILDSLEISYDVDLLIGLFRDYLEGDQSGRAINRKKNDTVRTSSLEPTRNGYEAMSFIPDNIDKPILSVGVSAIAADEIAFAKKFPQAKIIATTIDEKGMDIVKKNAKEAGVEDQIEFKLEDATKPWPYADNSIGFVYARLILHYLNKDQIRFAMSEMQRVAEPGAKIFVSVLSDEHHWANPEGVYDGLEGFDAEFIPAKEGMKYGSVIDNNTGEYLWRFDPETRFMHFWDILAREYRQRQFLSPDQLLEYAREVDLFVNPDYLWRHGEQSFWDFARTKAVSHTAQLLTMVATKKIEIDPKEDLALTVFRSNVLKEEKRLLSDIQHNEGVNIHAVGRLARKAVINVKPLIETHRNSYKHDPNSVVYKTKKNGSKVSETEMEIEKTIIEMILAEYPDHGIWGEEEEYRDHELNQKILANKNSPFKWIIDPVDGTTELPEGSEFAVVVTLLYEGYPVSAMVYEPMQEAEGFLFEARIDLEGAYLNGEKISIDDKTKFKGLEVSAARHIAQKLESFSDKLKESVGTYVEQTTSQAFYLTQVAASESLGGPSLVVRLNPSVEHTLGPAFIAIKAGGVAQDFQGRDIFPLSEELQRSTSVPALKGGLLVGTESSVKKVQDLILDQTPEEVILTPSDRTQWTKEEGLTLAWEIIQDLSQRKIHPILMQKIRALKAQQADSDVVNNPDDYIADLHLIKDARKVAFKNNQNRTFLDFIIAIERGVAKKYTKLIRSKVSVSSSIEKSQVQFITRHMQQALLNLFLSSEMSSTTRYVYAQIEQDIFNMIHPNLEEAVKEQGFQKTDTQYTKLREMVRQEQGWEERLTKAIQFQVVSNILEMTYFKPELLNFEDIQSRMADINGSLDKVINRLKEKPKGNILMYLDNPGELPLNMITAELLLERGYDVYLVAKDKAARDDLTVNDVQRYLSGWINEDESTRFQWLGDYYGDNLQGNQLRVLSTDSNIGGLNLAAFSEEHVELRKDAALIFYNGGGNHYGASRSALEQDSFFGFAIKEPIQTAVTMAYGVPQQIAEKALVFLYKEAGEKGIDLNEMAQIQNKEQHFFVPFNEEVYSDSAMATKNPQILPVQNPGGIDLNPGHMNLQAQGDVIQWEQLPSVQDFDNMPMIKGFVPVIIDILPLQNINMLWGGVGVEEDSTENLSRLD